MKILFFETKTGIPVTLWLGCVGATDGFSMVALNKHCLNKLLNKMIIVQKSVKLRGDDDDDDDARVCLLILSMILCPTDSPAAFCKSHQSRLMLMLMLIMAFSVTHTRENYQFIYSLKGEAHFHQENL